MKIPLRPSRLTEELDVPEREHGGIVELHPIGWPGADVGSQGSHRGERGIKKWQRLGGLLLFLVIRPDLREAEINLSARDLYRTGGFSLAPGGIWGDICWFGGEKRCCCHGPRSTDAPQGPGPATPAKPRLVSSHPRFVPPAAAHPCRGRTETAWRAER